MWKLSCPSSIWCRDSNSLPLKHESPPITTRPELPPTKNKCESLFQLDIFHEDDIILHSIFFVGWLSLWLWPAGIPQSKLPRQQLLCHEQQVLIRFRDLFASFCASEITKMQQNRTATMTMYFKMCLWTENCKWTNPGLFVHCGSFNA